MTVRRVWRQFKVKVGQIEDGGVPGHHKVLNLRCRTGRMTHQIENGQIRSRSFIQRLVILGPRHSLIGDFVDNVATRDALLRRFRVKLRGLLSDVDFRRQNSDNVFRDAVVAVPLLVDRFWRVFALRNADQNKTSGLLETRDVVGVSALKDDRVHLLGQVLSAESAKWSWDGNSSLNVCLLTQKLVVHVGPNRSRTKKI